MQLIRIGYNHDTGKKLGNLIVVHNQGLKKFQLGFSSEIEVPRNLHSSGSLEPGNSSSNSSLLFRPIFATLRRVRFNKVNKKENLKKNQESLRSKFHSALLINPYTVIAAINFALFYALSQTVVNFMFSKKATKIDEIFTVDLTLTT